MAIVLSQQDLLNSKLSPTLTHYAYNGLDNLATQELASAVLLPRLAADPDAMRTYLMEMGTNQVALCMTLRGVLLDESARQESIVALEEDQLHAETELTAACAYIWDRKHPIKGKCLDGKNHGWPRGIDPGEAKCKKCGAARMVPDGPNPRSFPQIMHLLYDLMAIPEQQNKKHQKSVDDEVLQRLIRRYPKHCGVLLAIEKCRKVRKQISMLKSPCDPDGRWRSSFNVGATEVDRWSASKSPVRTGINIQQVAERSRHVIVADPGFMICYADLEQAESRIVAYDAEDLEYIKAHESEYDVHTYVAAQCWPELGWTGDPELDLKLAEQMTSFDPHHSYRLYSKKVQHGGNIGMSFYGVARDLHISEATAKEALNRLDRAFPRRKVRQREIIQEVMNTGSLRSFLGRRRQFFERLYEPSTHREALAQTQQHSIAWLLNMGMWRVWWELDTSLGLYRAPRVDDPNKVWLLAQVHDAILFLVRDGDFETMERVRELMTIPMAIRGRTCVVPVEVLYGYNWRDLKVKEIA